MRKNKPVQVKSMLENLTLDQLQVLAAIKSDQKTFDILLTIVRGEVETAKDRILVLPEGDPLKLALNKSFERGGIQKLTIFIHALDGAGDELERRANIKE